MISPKGIKVQGPVITGRGRHVVGRRAEGYEDGYAAVEGDGGEILIEKRLKEDNFVPFL
jgi:hypothetical protein